MHALPLLVYYLCLALTAASLTSCTINLSFVQSSGNSEDVIDNDQSPENTATLKIPVPNEKILRLPPV